MARIPLIRPTVTFDDVADDLRAILDSGRLTGGPFVERFEQSVAERLGVSHAVATTSATTALHLSLAALGIGPGDEVLVSDFTFPASGNVIVQTGAAPVLVDCVPGRFDIDPEAAASAVTDRTKAIMPVDPFGQPALLGPLHELAAQRGLAVVEDAACAFGAVRNGRPCGSWAGLGCFSFHPRKVLTTGEGGMVVTGDATLAERLRLLCNHGGARSDGSLRFVETGFNYRLSEIQAALGLAQLRRAEEILADRRRTAAVYRERLSDLDDVAVPLSADPADCTFQSMVVLLSEGIDRDRVIRDMAARDIETTLGTYALHAQPAFASYGYAPGNLPYSWRAQQSSLTLPLFYGMDEKTIDEVVTALRESIAA